MKVKMVFKLKILALSSFVLMSLLTSTLVSAADQQNKIYVNSQLVQSDVAPLMVKGRILVPVRALTDLQLTFSWDNKTKTATIVNSKTKDNLKLTENKLVAYKNDVPIKLDVPVSSIKGRTMVPLRFIAEAFGAEVKWEKSINAVLVKSSDKIGLYSSLKTGELVDARKAAVLLPTTELTDDLSPEDARGSTTYYYFPEGEALRYYIQFEDIKSYIEINEYGIKEVLYQARLDNAEKVTEERGTQPPKDDKNKSLIYFAYSFHLGKVEYGKINKDGVITKIGDKTFTVNNTPIEAFIQEIPNEKRIDG